MAFNKIGMTIIRYDEKYTLKIIQPDYFVLEHQETNEPSIHMREDFVRDYIDGHIYAEGSSNPQGNQDLLTDKQWDNINYRFPYAEAFNARKIRRQEIGYLTRRIHRDQGHTKKIPSRSSCYLWAKILRESGGDPKSLR
ncbi:hypothetical protein BST95_12685 [Halioglobus japonicus]|uniref:Uncharacterized protein n=1 Tax=Halioglobus japonicus TaxID=930805 RepID=A0AAP8MHY1_9GAMM|nr:hypothetical protein [Halioglobus japonicus]AQA18971.1 hypothetical protein BST95_12685 [Halioglobus japonicus]PLW88014.1 hypothetical protein C0029_05500 [Halioglobus japonicus]GHD20460.1 hypothetical protein GCM10007052_30100 [Halioglobus japonicus]